MIKTSESRFSLLKVCLFVKLESSDCRIYWTKTARLDQSKIRLDRSNLVQIYFSAEFPIQPKPIWHVGFYVLLKYKRKNPSYVLDVFDVLCVESLMRSRSVYLHTHLGLSRSRFMSRTWWSLQLLHKENLKHLSGVSKSQVGVLVVVVDQGK